MDCAGIESPGLSASPAIGLEVAALVRDILHLAENPDFDPCRKGILDPKTLSFEERAALIREHPAYGQIVCRCETVTEGEILDAIHRVPGARSLDGVKRRTPRRDGALSGPGSAAPGYWKFWPGNWECPPKSSPSAAAIPGSFWAPTRTHCRRAAV